MAFEQMPSGGVMVTGARDIETVRLIALRGALSFEIKTGMLRSSRGPSTLALVNHALGATHRRKQAAYAALDAHLVTLGASSRPLA